MKKYYQTIGHAADAVQKSGKRIALVVWNGLCYQFHNVNARGFGGCLIGYPAEVDALVARAKAEGFSYGMVHYLAGKARGVPADSTGEAG